MTGSKASPSPIFDFLLQIRRGATKRAAAETAVPAPDPLALGEHPAPCVSGFASSCGSSTARPPYASSVYPSSWLLSAHTVEANVALADVLSSCER